MGRQLHGFVRAILAQGPMFVRILYMEFLVFFVCCMAFCFVLLLVTST